MLDKTLNKMNTSSGKQTAKITAKKNNSIFWSPKLITVKELLDLKEKGKLDATMSYQRKAGIGIWNKAVHIDKFIDSLMRGWFIQPFQWRGSEDGTFQIVDSLQRVTAISRIYGDFYTPTTLKEPLEHLNGKPFSMWPKKDQTTFLEKKILVMLIDEKDDEKIIEYFVRLNKGVMPLTNAQAKRGLFAHSLVLLKDVLGHDVWELPLVNLDITARENIIMQLTNSLVSENPDHTSKLLVDWFVDWKPNIVIINQLLKKMEILNKILKLAPSDESEEDYKIAKRFSKRIHLESILYNLRGDEKEDEIKEKYLRLIKFFGVSKAERPEERKEYTDLVYQDTSSHASIIKRHEIIRCVLMGEIEYPVIKADIKAIEDELNDPEDMDEGIDKYDAMREKVRQSVLVDLKVEDLEHITSS